MCKLYINLFGRFEIRRDDTPLLGMDVPRLEELLSYLLLNRYHPQLREKVADLLWGEKPANNSRSYLRKAIWQMQTALSNHEPQGPPLILVDQDWLQINPDLDYWLDVAEFEKVFNRVRGISGGNLDEDSAGQVESAVGLYRGDLLENWYCDWCIYERERLQYEYLAMLDKLISYCEMHHQYERGVMFGEKCLRYDRAHESTHQRMMRLFYLIGDRTSALRQYKHCVAALKEDLGVEPSHTTIMLFELIRDDQIDIDSAVAMTEVREVMGNTEKIQMTNAEITPIIREQSGVDKGDTFVLLVRSLLQIDSALALVHHKVQEEIHTILNAIRQNT